MVTSELDAVDVEGGRAFVERLRAQQVTVDGAYWRFDPDRERWLLNIVSPQAQSGSKDLYLKAIAAKPAFDISSVQFLSPKDESVQAMSKAGLFSRKQNDLLRLKGAGYNGVYLDNAIVYGFAPAS